MSNEVQLQNFDNGNLSKITESGEGITTIWLLSTLGNNQSLLNSKLNRAVSDKEKKNGSNLTASDRSSLRKKDIINVSIPSTCKVIEKNDLELPLRYISNLLYGVTICYGKKTDFVLNDINTLILQLNRKIFQTVKINKNGLTTIYDSQTGKSNKNKQTQKNSKADQNFLVDDPLFNINEIQRFEDLLNSNVNSGNSSKIRKIDILNELSNSNNFELNQNFTLGKNFEDLPLDLDFQLDIDDLISQQGTSIPSSNKALSDKGNNDVDYNFDNHQEFNLDFDNDNKINENQRIPSVDLELLKVAENDHGSESDETTLDEESIDGPPMKKKKINKSFKGSTQAFFMPLKFDERTGLSTDFLRQNYDQYNQVMDIHQSKKLGLLRNQQKVKTLDYLEQLLTDTSINDYVNHGRKLLLLNNSNSFEKLIHKNSENTKLNHLYNIEHGRKRATSLPSSAGSNYPSEEKGRRMSNELGNNFLDENFSYNDNNMLINLEQIDEEMNESENDYMNLNLELPPSSIGRSNTRASGTQQGTDNDVIDVLQSRIGMHKIRRHSSLTTTSNLESIPSITSSDTNSDNLINKNRIEVNQLLDSQSKKFLDYIKERSSIAGKTTNSFYPYSSKILFEDLVPSVLFETDTRNPTKAISKKVAANAFLSLLNLASKNSIGLRKFSIEDTKPSPDFKKYKIMSGDELIVYV